MKMSYLIRKYLSYLFNNSVKFKQYKAKKHMLVFSKHLFPVYLDAARIIIHIIHDALAVIFVTTHFSFQLTYYY